MTESRLWFEVAILLSLFAAGGILFGHFEEGTPKWRRLLKMALMTCGLTAVSFRFGRFWFWSLLGVMATIVAIIHLWWLPRHGINGWTGEPMDKYYALRGWTPRQGNPPGSETAGPLDARQPPRATGNPPRA